MKKKLILVMTLCLIAVLASILVACDKGADSLDDYNVAKMEESLNELRNSDGIAITYSVVSEGMATTVSFAAKNELYYFNVAGEAEVYFDLSKGDTADMYTKDGNNWVKYSMAKSSIENSLNGYFQGLTLYLSAYTNYKNVDAKKSSGKVAGRDCDIFSFDYVLKNANAKCEVAVDKKTGICLKVSATMDGKTESMECTKFDTKPTIVLPENATSGGNIPNSGGSGQGGSGQGGSGQGGSGQGSSGGQYNTDPYQVTQRRWEEIFTDKVLVAGGSNFSVMYRNDPNVGNLYVAANKYKVVPYIGDYEYYYVKTGNVADQNGCYPYTYKMYNTNTSTMQQEINDASYDLASFDKYTGTLPAPYASAVYNETEHCYEIESFTYVENAETITIDNFRVYFQNNYPSRIEYSIHNANYATFFYSNVDNTTVTLPGEGAAATSTKTLPSATSVISSIGSLYKVTATNGAGGAPTTVASDGTYDYVSTTYVSFSKRIGDNQYYPYTDLRDGKYHKMGTPNYYPEDSLATILARVDRDFFYYAGKTISYHTETATTEVLGRPAKKYTYTRTNGNQTYNEELIIDDATGACLKHVGGGAPTDGFTGGEVKDTFILTEFEYGVSNEPARTLLDGMIAKIDVYEWDTDFLTQVGLTGTIAAPQGTFWYSGWYDDTSRDVAPDWCVQYKLYSDTQDEYKEYLENLALSFYNAGANYDDGAVKTFENLYYDNGDDVSFSAYVVDNTDYCVIVIANYYTYATDHYWSIEIEIYDEAA